MHTDKLFVVFGSDSRFEYTAKALESRGYRVLDFCSLSPDKYSELADISKILVLPLPFSRDKKTVNLPSLPYCVTLRGVISLLKNGDTVMAGMPDREFSEECVKNGAVCIDYYDREMTDKNAVLTAKSLLMLTEKEKLCVRGLKFAVTGFGRTAKAVAREFEERGFDFVIAARSPSAQAEALEKGYSFVFLDGFETVSRDFDVIINTVPALIFDINRLSQLKKGVTLIDVASAPFGVTADDAEKTGVRLIRALGLPGRFMPEKAGELIADSIEKHLKGR